MWKEIGTVAGNYFGPIGSFVGGAIGSALDGSGNNTGSQMSSTSGGILDGIEGWLSRYPNTMRTVGSIATNYQNARMSTTTGQEMEDKIRTGLKYGIHPLESIGGNTSGGTTIPLQNPLAQIEQVQPVDRVQEEIKRHTLAQLEEESRNSSSLLVGPISLYPNGPKVYWGFNQKFQAWGTFANTLISAANYEQIAKDIRKKLGAKAEQQFNEAAKKAFKREANPGGPQP